MDIFIKLQKKQKRSVREKESRKAWTNEKKRKKNLSFFLSSSFFFIYVAFDHRSIDRTNERCIYTRKEMPLYEQNDYWKK